MASLPPDTDREIRRKLQAGFDGIACAALEVVWEAEKLQEQLQELFEETEEGKNE